MFIRVKLRPHRGIIDSLIKTCESNRVSAKVNHAWGLISHSLLVVARYARAGLRRLIDDILVLLDFLGLVRRHDSKKAEGFH